MAEQLEDWKCKACGKLLEKKTISFETSIYFTRYITSCSCGDINILMDKKR